MKTLYIDGIEFSNYEEFLKILSTRLLSGIGEVNKIESLEALSDILEGGYKLNDLGEISMSKRRNQAKASNP